MEVRTLWRLEMPFAWRRNWFGAGSTKESSRNLPRFLSLWKHKRRNGGSFNGKIGVFVPGTRLTVPGHGQGTSREPSGSPKCVRGGGPSPGILGLRSVLQRQRRGPEADGKHAARDFDGICGDVPCAGGKWSSAGLRRGA